MVERLNGLMGCFLADFRESARKTHPRPSLRNSQGGGPQYYGSAEFGKSHQNLSPSLPMSVGKGARDTECRGRMGFKKEKDKGKMKKEKIGAVTLR